MIQHTHEHCTDTFAHTNKDTAAYRFKKYDFQIWSWESTRGFHMGNTFGCFFLLLILCKCKQAAVWSPDDPVLYLLVKGISYFLTITLSKEKSVKRNNNRSHKPCKQKTRMKKQNGSVYSIITSPAVQFRGLKGNRTKCGEENHSVIWVYSILLTPSHHCDHKDLAALRGPSDPRFQLERLERSQDKCRRVLSQTTQTPPFTSSSWHTRATGWLQTQFRATSKCRLKKAQMVNFSRVSINYKEPDISPERWGQRWHLNRDRHGCCVTAKDAAIKHVCFCAHFG